MAINWNRDESKYKTPTNDDPIVGTPKSLDDIIDQLNSTSLVDSDDEAKSQAKTISISMAKLHAVLTKSATPHETYLKQAEIRAGKARESIVKAWEIVKQAREAAATSENKTKDDVDIFPFLALPTELRLLIYQELLVTDTPLMLDRRGPRKALQDGNKVLYISIMQTCKKCAEEGATVLYGNNLFDFKEIRHRPFFARTISSIIGAKNASLIRFIVAAYPAPYEELSREPGEGSEERTRHWKDKPNYHALTRKYVADFFQAFGIELEQLRLLAISIVPFGMDDASMSVLRTQVPGLGTSKAAKEAWVQSKNAALPDLIDEICAREGVMKRTSSAVIAAKLPCEWGLSFKDRYWIEYERQGPFKAKGRETGENLHTFSTKALSEITEAIDSNQESPFVDDFRVNQW